MEPIVTKCDNVVDNIYFSKTILGGEYSPDVSNVVLGLQMKMVKQN